ncbi:phage portal protein [Gammaproteobacteria bacterium LSUCC0112]|nr:phage portal protein [Gammaproteobacteria bacterium LSUCC0112]
MSIFSFLRKVKQSEKAFEANWMGSSDDIATTESNLLAANKEWVFIATDKNANSAKAVRYKVMKYTKNGDDQEVFSGPLVDFLQSPAQGFTGKDFIYLNTAWKELVGNAFWEIDGKNLKPLIPTSVVPVLTSGVITAYDVHHAGKVRRIPAENVLHDRYVDPARPHWGAGKLSKIARWVDTSGFSNEFLRRFFLNGATFGGFIETEEESEARIKLIKLGLANDHVGVANAHKTGVLPKGAKYQRVTGNMSEIEMGSTDDRYRDKILAAFGVPKNILGLTQGENRATVEGTEYAYMKHTIKPIVDDLIEFLNLHIAPLFDKTGQYYFAYDSFIPVNMEIELKEREIALAKQPYKTVNEVRASMGLPPVKGGDTIYGNPFQVPLGSPAPVQEEPDDEEEDEPKKAIPQRARAFLKKEHLVDSIAKSFEKATKSIDLRDIADEAASKKFVARVAAHELLLVDKIRAFNNEQERNVQMNLNSITKAVSKGDVFDMDVEVSALIDIVSPLLKGLMLEQAIEEYKAQGFVGTLDTSASTISKAIELASKRLAKSYNNTTAKLLKNALNEGIQAGDSTAQLAERVKTVYEYSNQVRALMVARTESVYIANEGSKEAYKQSGVVKTIRWYTAEDERECEFCAPMNGKIIGVHENFFKKGDVAQGRDGGTLPLDYRGIDVPPLHTNCRCLIRAEEIEVN